MRPLSACKEAVLLIACLFLVLVGPGQARGESFRCSRAGSGGPSLQWAERNIAYGLAFGTELGVGISLTELLEVMDSAFAEWQSPDCSDLSFTFEGVSEAFQTGFRRSQPNANGIAYASEWSFNPDAVALTITSFDTGSGRLLDADITLNGEHFDFVVFEAGCETDASDQGPMDLQNVLTHEVGHLVGLDHPPSTPSNSATTMFGTSQACETLKRDLSTGDVEGLCTIYPAGQPTRSCYAADSIGFEVVSSGSETGSGCRHFGAPVGPASWLLGMALFLLVRFRRRRMADPRHGRRHHAMCDP